MYAMPGANFTITRKETHFHNNVCVHQNLMLATGLIKGFSNLFMIGIIVHAPRGAQSSCIIFSSK